MPTASEIARDVVWDWDSMKTKGAPDPDRVVLARTHLRLREAGLLLSESWGWPHQPRCPEEKKDCAVCDFMDALEETNEAETA